MTEAPGQAVVLDRLLDALLVAALRAAGTGGERPGDPPIDKVLAHLHAHPQVPVSVEAMARTRRRDASGLTLRRILIDASSTSAGALRPWTVARNGGPHSSTGRSRVSSTIRVRDVTSSGGREPAHPA